MKKLTTLLMTLMLMSTALWAQETITVSAKSTDISEGLDLKVVAKLFADAKNLEEFEKMLNNPDSAFCNLDLNGDGQVDYLRVVEMGEGNKRLIVLQAVLAKDIFQDVASIYVEKDEKNEVSVQVVGDEYVYGANYVIEPVYIYRPLIYDWFWSDAWYAWHSPWYWGYWPGWWYAHSCWAHDWYWHHCYAYHHHHYCCSFRHAPQPRHGYHEMHRNVSRRDYATAHPDRSFSRRNTGMTNAREIRSTTSVRSTRQTATAAPASRTTAAPATRTTATATRSTATATRSTATTTRTTSPSRTTSSTRTTSTPSSTRSTSTSVARTPSSTRTTSSTATRSTSTTASRPTSAPSSTRSTSSTATRTTSSAGSYRPSSSSSSTRTTSAPSGGSRSGGGGGSRPSGGGGGGGRTTRR